MEEVILKVLGVWVAMVVLALYYCFEYGKELDK